LRNQQVSNGGCADKAMAIGKEDSGSLHLPTAAIAHLLRRTLVVLAAGLGLCGLLLGSAVLSPRIRDLLADHAASFIQDRYHVIVRHDGFHLTREGSIWTLRLKHLRVSPLGPTSWTPLSLDELSITTPSLAVWNHAAFKPSFKLRGLKAEIEILPDRIRLPSANFSLSVDDLQDYLSHPSKEDKDQSVIKELSWQETAIDIHYGPSAERERSRLLSSGHWDANEQLKALTLRVKSLNAAKLMHSLNVLISRMPDLTIHAQVLEKLTAIRSASVMDLMIECAAPASCLGSFDLEDLSWQGQGWIPGLSGLKARIDAKPGAITVTLPTQDLDLDYPIVDKRSLRIETPKTVFGLRYDADDFTLTLPRTSLHLASIETHVRADIKIPRADGQGLSLDLDIGGHGAELLSVFRRLPSELIGLNTKLWLSNHFQAGQLADFKVRVKGTLPETPLVTVDAGFVRTHLKFKEDWPALSDCRGRFLMRGLDMTIPIESCRSKAVTARDGRVHIYGIERDEPQIDIEVRAQSSVQDAFGYLTASPLRGLGEAFLAVPVLGESQLTRLRIHVPLSKSPPQEVKVQGDSILQKVSLDVKAGIFQGMSERIDLSFDQQGLVNLKGVVQSASDTSRVELKRDKGYLRGNIEPVTTTEGALRGRLKIVPLGAPEFVTAQITGYKFTQGEASMDFDELIWQLGSSQSLSIKGQAQVFDFGKLCRALGLEGKFKGGKGRIHFDLDLTDLQSKLSAPAIQGELSLDLKAGEILELPRAAVAIVDFANLKALGIRSQGLAFDFMTGDLKFQGGRLEILKGNAGLGIIDVKIVGSIDYILKRLNLTLDIIPDLGSPAAALAIGLWHPLFGLGLFGLSQLQDKASDSPLNRVMTQTYRLEGPLDDAKVHLIRPFNFQNAF
jgi:uncharacterized protein YhdP